MKASSSAKGDEGFAVFEQNAQDVGELYDHLAGELWLGADERRDGVEGVEEEVRIDLALEGVELGFEQESRLFFELAFDADLVPDLQWDSDDDGGAETDGDLDPPGS